MHDTVAYPYLKGSILIKSEDFLYYSCADYYEWSDLFSEVKDFSAILYLRSKVYNKW